MRCDYCDTRIDDHPFWYRDRPFCCECMSALCSWFLDGGFRENPKMFEFVEPHSLAAATPETEDVPAP